jgi:2-phospho-L-lactate guanylyltransferase
VLAIVPLRSFDTAKSRLDPGVGPGARRRVAAAVAERVVVACRVPGWEVVVVAPPGDVAGWCEQRGIDRIDDPGGGLDAAAAAGVSAAGGSWLVVHGDLPLLTPEDLDGIAESVTAGITVLAPSRDGGTNLIAARGPFHFAYGPGSFVRHLSAASPPARVVIRAGLAVELDTAADLAAVLRHPRGAWLGPLLS